MFEYIITIFKVVVGVITNERLVLASLVALGVLLLWIVFSLCFSFEMRFISGSKKINKYISRKGISGESKQALAKLVQKMPSEFVRGYNTYEKNPHSLPSKYIKRSDCLDLELNGGVFNQNRSIIKSFINFVFFGLLLFSFAIMSSSSLFESGTASTETALTGYMVAEAMLIPFLYLFVAKGLYYIYTAIRQHQYHVAVEEFNEMIDNFDKSAVDTYGYIPSALVKAKSDFSEMSSRNIEQKNISKASVQKVFSSSISNNETEKEEIISTPENQNNLNINNLSTNDFVEQTDNASAISESNSKSFEESFSNSENVKDDISDNNVVYKEQSENTLLDGNNRGNSESSLKDFDDIGSAEGYSEMAGTSKNNEEFAGDDFVFNNDLNIVQETNVNQSARGDLQKNPYGIEEENQNVESKTSNTFYIKETNNKEQPKESKVASSSRLTSDFEKFLKRFEDDYKQSKTKKEQQMDKTAEIKDNFKPDFSTLLGEEQAPKRGRGRPKKETNNQEGFLIKNDKEFEDALVRAEKLMRKNEEPLSASQTKRIEKQLKELIDAMSKYKESK